VIQRAVVQPATQHPVVHVIHALATAAQAAVTIVVAQAVTIAATAVMTVTSAISAKLGFHNATKAQISTG